MSEELEWTHMGDGSHEAYGDGFHYTIHQHPGGWIASALSAGDGVTEVKVAQCVARTLDYAKRAPQMWEFQQQVHKAWWFDGNA